MLKMGCAKVDITPKFQVFLRGYGARNCLSNEIEERLEAGIMILAQGKKKQLLITLDNLGINIRCCERIYADLKEATGFDASNTYLCCSHTHFAPGMEDYYVTFPGGDIPIGKYPAEKKYYTFWLKQIVAGIKEAEANLEQVELEETVIPVSSVSFNRRTIVKATGKVVTNYTWPTKTVADYDFQPVDTQFNVWRFKAGDKLKAIVGRFSCHPVTGGHNQYGVSADYPGYFQKYIREFFGCPGFFILGSAGDVVPMQRQGTARKDIGMILASAVRLAERTFQKAIDFKLGNETILVPLKLRVKCDRRKADALWNAAVEKARGEKDYDENLGWLAYKHSFVKMYPADDVEVPLRLMRLGTKVLVGMPFEVLTEIGLKLREACPEAVLTSITGGYDGYLPLAKEYKRGGYEATWGPRFN
ncbi:MAG: neutral/alkaline non-lysosomal ceramidase N-terminal domain-containing protein, partial [Victivallales bacterium]|nr:neutral/alkaline non-lysosomal ceramidase N-terminal domain-containing protein [Victivallales bacterium]